MGHPLYPNGGDAIRLGRGEMCPDGEGALRRGLGRARGFCAESSVCLSVRTSVEVCILRCLWTSGHFPGRWWDTGQAIGHPVTSTVHDRLWTLFVGNSPSRMMNVSEWNGDGVFLADTRNGLREMMYDLFCGGCAAPHIFPSFSVPLWQLWMGLQTDTIFCGICSTFDISSGQVANAGHGWGGAEMLANAADATQLKLQTVCHS